MIPIIIIAVVVVGIVIFVSKSAKGVQKSGETCDLIMKLLDFQIDKVEDKEKLLVDEWILGYIVGMCQMAMHGMGMGRTEFGVMFKLVLAHVYGESNLERKMTQSTALMSSGDKEFMAGNDSGAFELDTFIKNPEELNAPKGIIEKYT